MITNYGKGNYELSNLPRKINFALSPSRDDFPHVFINDVGLQAIKHPETGEVCDLRIGAKLHETMRLIKDWLLSLFIHLFL